MGLGSDRLVFFRNSFGAGSGQTSATRVLLALAHALVKQNVQLAEIYPEYTIYQKHGRTILDIYGPTTRFRWIECGRCELAILNPISESGPAPAAKVSPPPEFESEMPAATADHAV
jgi:hypothetical protein